MEKIMVLKAVSPLKSREYSDAKTGGTNTIYWVELTLTDGTDTIIGELIVPATVDEQGQRVHRQPEFTTEWMYAVAAEIEGASGTTNDGKEWSRNRIRIRKITKL